jgi:hypothetical protein
VGRTVLRFLGLWRRFAATPVRRAGGPDRKGIQPRHRGTAKGGTVRRRAGKLEATPEFLAFSMADLESARRRGIRKNPRRFFPVSGVITAMWGPRRLAILIAAALASCTPEPPIPAPPPPVTLLPPPAPITPAPSYADTELSCLALTIYWEGKSESQQGQIAIAHVVLNRTRSASFPNTICGVVHQGGQTPRLQCQFHWWCDGKSDKPTNAAQWETAQKIARSETQPGAEDPTGGALYFHNGTVSPDWSRTRTRTAKIGQHTFYR